MKTTNSAAKVIGEYGPFAEGERANGVTWDGERVWLATGTRLRAIDPDSGVEVRGLEVACDAGTAFDGRWLYQLAEARILVIDPKSGEVVRTIPAPGGGRDAGLTWAEGTLWVGQYLDRTIHQIDAQTGAILRTLRSDRYVTGVSWVDGELWHATWEGESSDLRRVDAETGEVLERVQMPEGMGVSGLESDGADRFFCGGGGSGKLRVVERPRRKRANSASSDDAPARAR